MLAPCINSVEHSLLPAWREHSLTILNSSRHHQTVQIENQDIQQQPETRIASDAFHTDRPLIWKLSHKQQATVAANSSGDHSSCSTA